MTYREQIDQACDEYRANLDRSVEEYKARREASYRILKANMKRDIGRIFWRIEKWCLGAMVVSGILLAVAHWWPR